MKDAGLTAGELIKALQDIPPGTLVLVRGYEGGYDSIRGIAPRDVGDSYGPNNSSCFGRYDDYDDLESESRFLGEIPPHHPRIHAVYLR